MESLPEALEKAIYDRAAALFPSESEEPKREAYRLGAREFARPEISPAKDAFHCGYCGDERNPNRLIAGVCEEHFENGELVPVPSRNFNVGIDK